MRLILTLITLLTLLYLFPPLTLAHILKTDGSIGAVIHITPDDDPIIGQPAQFYFELKDTSGKFKATQCNCLITIEKDKKVLSTHSLFEESGTNDLNNPSFTYTFPTKGIYLLKVTGAPLETAGFQPFTLTYDLRIDRDAVGKTPTSKHSWLPTITIFTSILLFLAIILFRKNKEKHV